MPFSARSPNHARAFAVSDASTTLRTLQPVEQKLFATKGYRVCQGSLVCAQKKRASLFMCPCRVHRVSVRRVRKVGSLTSRGVYAAVSAVVVKESLRLHAACRVELARRLKRRYDILLLLISMCILSSSFSLSVFTVALLQLNATSAMGISRGDKYFADTAFIDTQVALTTFHLSIYLLLAAHCWLLWGQGKGPHGMTRTLSAAAAIGIMMLRFIHSDPF